jgi:hypothetical protein
MLSMLNAAQTPKKPSNEIRTVVLFAHHIVLEKCDYRSIEFVPSL